MTPTSGQRSDGRWLRLGPAAELLGVSINTARRWSDAGKIPTYRSAGGHRRFRRKDLEMLLAAQAADAPRDGSRARRPADPDKLERLERRTHDLEALLKASLADTSLRSTDRILHDVAKRLGQVDQGARRRHLRHPRGHAAGAGELRRRQLRPHLGGRRSAPQRLSLQRDRGGAAQGRLRARASTTRSSPSSAASRCASTAISRSSPRRFSARAASSAFSSSPTTCRATSAT